MIDSQPIEIIKDIKDESDEYENAIFCTYSFDGRFFEEKVIPVLQKADAKNILLLTDKSKYQSSFSDVKRAGHDYYFDYCKCGSIFHPKIIFLTWGKGGKLILGSQNMTDVEWNRAGELLVNINYNIENPDKDASSAFLQVRNFFNRLIEKDMLRSIKHKQKLIQALQETEWLKNIDTIKSDKINIIHNIDSSILNQIFDIIGNEKIIKVDVISPIFDKNATVLKELIKHNCKEVRIFLQPQRAIGFPKDEIRKISETMKNIHIFSMNFKDKETRFIHAKLLLFITNKNSYCIFGSSNFTKSGLLSTAKEGNVELCILRKEEKSDYFDYILDPKIFNLKEIKPESVAENEGDFLFQNENKINLTDARIEGTNLIINFEPEVESKEAKINFNHSNNEDNLIYTKNITNKNSIIINLNEKEQKFLKEPSFVSISIESNNNFIESDKRWVSTSILELIPRRYDIDKIEASNGRFGLIDLFNKLEKSSGNLEWFLYYIKWLDFENLGDSADEIRRRLLKRKFDGDEDNNIQLLEKENIDPQEVLDKILERNRKKLDKSIEMLKINDEVYEKIERLFNLFISLNKVTLWFVIGKKAKIEELRHIRNNLVAINKLIEKFLWGSKKDRISSLFSGIQLWAHIMVICYIINRIHTSSNYHQFGVLDVFRETYIELLNHRDVKNFDYYEADIIKVINEYREFENLALDKEEIIKFCKGICK